MTIFKLVINSFKHYFRANIAIALGISISTAVITGALIVGDSVNFSLQKAAKYRLGNIHYSLTAGDRFFSTNFSQKLQDKSIANYASVLKLEGIALANGGEFRINNVQIWGVDNHFSQVLGTDYPFDSIKDDEILISKNTAEKLNLNIGDNLLLKIKKASLIPLNTPFVSSDNQTVSKRVFISGIIGKENFSRVSFNNSQTAPYNIFVPLAWLNKAVNLENTTNIIITDDDVFNEKMVSSQISLEDVNLNLEVIENKIRITSKRVFIDNSLSDSVLAGYPNANPSITYFVNEISNGNASCPYSFVSTNSELQKGEILLNTWLAEDINAKIGDTIKLNYYVVGPLRKLDTAETVFIIKDIIPFENNISYQKLMPDFPGLSDAGNCRDWETGIPIILDKIRDKDEEYWKEFKGTPKAFISTEQAKEIWENRFGAYTSIDIYNENIEDVTKKLQSKINPFSIGFQINPVKEQGAFAAKNGTDFSQLFIGLSFFIIVSGLLLTVLLFLFNLDVRDSQIGTFRAVGFSQSLIRKIFLFESLFISISGATLGIILALLYNKLVFIGLDRVWQDIVRTSILEIQINAKTLIIGFLISIIVSWLTIAISLNKRLKRQVNQAQRMEVKRSNTFNRNIKLILIILFALIPIGILFSQFYNSAYLNESMFFMAGASLLISFLFFVDFLFFKLNRSESMSLTIRKLSWKNMLVNRRRSILVVLLLSIGSFLVVTTGGNRKDLFANSNLKTSGTGGFEYFAKSTLPILNDLNNAAIKLEYGISDSADILQFRTLSGDDASCLNLNRISNPQILGVNPEYLQGHFSFVSKSDDLDEANPWLSLDNQSGTIIPAIADQTVIQWSLGMKVGDTLTYLNEMGDTIYLKLIGGLAASIFQGNVIISNENFIKNYPSSSGSKVFLINGKSDNIEQDFNLAFKDLGWEMESAPARLANFKTIENTYLSIFLILGAFGLLLGSIGLAIVLARSISERKSEIALLMATGFSKSNIYLLIFREYFNLLIFGFLSGVLAAIISVLPSIINNQSLSFGFIASLLIILLANGMFWILLITLIQIRKIKINSSLRVE